MPHRERPRNLKSSRPCLLTLALVLALCCFESCAFVAETVTTGGEQPIRQAAVKPAQAPPALGARVIVFCQKDAVKKLQALFTRG